MSSGGKRRKVNSSDRLGKCDVCKTTVAIYTCPRCETVTCSLACVKTHKTQLDCDGVRVRTKFVPVDKMDGNTLLSDYRLMEDVSRCLEFVEAHRANIDATQPTVTDACEQDHHKQGGGQAQNKTVPDKGTPNLSNPNVNSDPQKPKKKSTRNDRRAMRKLGNANSNPTSGSSSSSGLPTKAELLIARANRVRSQVLKKNGAKTEQAPSETSETGEEQSTAVDNLDTTADATTTTTSPSSSYQQSEVTEELQVQTEQMVVDEEKSIPEHSIEECVEVVGSTVVVVEAESSNLESSSNKNNSGSSCPDQRRSQAENRKKLRKAQLFQSMKRGGRGKEVGMETLKKIALKRSIALKILPHKFHRHFENTSYFFQNENCIYWYIKVAFLNANLFTLSLNQCAETMTLENVVRGCLKRSRAYSLKSEVKDPLEVYRSLGMSKIGVLMVADKLPNGQKKFYQLDMALTLRENFVGKCIVEYPQLCVVLQDCFVAPEVKEDVVYNFFDDEEFPVEEGEEQSGKGDAPPSTKKSRKRKKLRNSNKDILLRRSGHGGGGGDNGRESGELTDSSGGNDSDVELFKESEFRSIYTDLLKTV